MLVSESDDMNIVNFIFPDFVHVKFGEASKSGALVRVNKCL